MYLNNNNCVLRYLEMRFASPRSDDENKRQGYSVIVYDRIREDSFSPCVPPPHTPKWCTVRVRWNTTVRVI